MRDALPGSISIDNLIDAHRNDSEFTEIGKLAIAKAILNSERDSKLFIYKDGLDSFHLSMVSGTYLIPLFQILSEGVSREDVSIIFDNVSFVVFNYGRTLEYFLPKALEIYYGLADHESRSIVDGANILHPYGRVGEFGRGKSLATAEYGSQRCNIRSIAEGIRTFNEGLADEGNGQQIRSLMQQADQVIFLGFAFHPLNMEILDPKCPTHIDKIFGNTLGLSDAAVRSVESSLLQTFRKRSPDDIMSKLDPQDSLSELNLEARSAADFLQAHFRGIA